MSEIGALPFPEDSSHPILDKSSTLPLDLLLLEDNDIDALVFQGAAANCSRALNVHRVSSLREFDAAIGAQPYHLVCADHLLPDGNAMDALRLAADKCPQAPFIVITGAGEEQLAVDYMKQGAADYLSKRRLDQFPLALDNVLRSYRNRALRHIAERQMERLNEELLALIRHVDLERDEEKKRLSRDIHDQLGQELTALKLGLFMLQKDLSAAPPEHQKALSKIDGLIDLNTGIIQQVRNIARSLRPVVLDQVGLVAGIESLVRDFNKREKTFYGFHFEELPPLPHDFKTDVFRMVQEALTNIARHAEAQLAYIRLSIQQEDLVVEIGDDGKGFTSDTTNGFPKGGLGLIGLRERARNHNGEITISSQLESGTTICATLPIPPLN